MHRNQRENPNKIPAYGTRRDLAPPRFPAGTSCGETKLSGRVQKGPGEPHPGYGMMHRSIEDGTHLGNPPGIYRTGRPSAVITASSGTSRLVSIT
jgi:hypothetical protein